MAALGTAFECPILVWMITLNRDYSLEVSFLAQTTFPLLTSLRNTTNATNS